MDTATLPPPKGSLQPLSPATPELGLTSGPAAFVLPLRRVCSPSLPLSHCINAASSCLTAKKEPFSCCLESQADSLLHQGVSIHRSSTSSLLLSFVTSCSWCSCCSRGPCEDPVHHLLVILEATQSHTSSCCSLIPCLSTHTHCETTPGRTTKCSPQPKSA